LPSANARIGNGPPALLSVLLGFVVVPPRASASNISSNMPRTRRVRVDSGGPMVGIRDNDNAGYGAACRRPFPGRMLADVVMFLRHRRLGASGGILATGFASGVRRYAFLAHLDIIARYRFFQSVGLDDRRGRAAATAATLSRRGSHCPPW